MLFCLIENTARRKPAQQMIEIAATAFAVTVSANIDFAQ
jgi:hypothetical protein